MGCAACFKSVDVVAPSHKAYKVPPGATGSDFPGHTWPSPPRCLRQVAPPAQVVGAETETPTDAFHRHSHCVVYPAEPTDHAAYRAEAILSSGSELRGPKMAVQAVPWAAEDSDIKENFGLGGRGHSGRVFADQDGLLELSRRQREALHHWRRLPELAGGSKGAPVVLLSSPTSRGICQGLVGDCSFLSALSSLAEYERKFDQPVLSGILHPRMEASEQQAQPQAQPQAQTRTQPAYNEYGKYGCRLFINGTMRKVVVDDRVPVCYNGRLLCAHSACGRELWVTLLEKSFAKIMGGSYDMQGSNPGTDVFHLTSWVPETIQLNGDATAASRPPKNQGVKWDDVFDEVAKGYREGCCVVCVGTSELSDAAPDAEARRLGHIEGVSISTGLVSRHAYPVLDCQQLGAQRLVRLKNPWGRVRWRGRFAPGSAAWKDLLPSAPGGTQQGLTELLGSDPSVEVADDGHFWIAWEDVVRYFSHLYLCWVPRALGLYTNEAHGRWDPGSHFQRSALRDDTHIVAFDPQCHLHFDEAPPSTGTVVWVLLSRHVLLRSELASKYVAVHIYAGKQRLCCPSAPLQQGVYSNGECALVKLRGEVLQGVQDLVLVVSQHAHKVPFNFTLQVHTAIPATLTSLPNLVPDNFVSGAAVGEWTAATAGGCSNSLWQYFSNPQWRLEVPSSATEGVTLILFLECPEEHSVNVRLFRGSAAKPERVRQADSSGPYRQGCCMLRVDGLPPGPYVAVVSTFRPGLQGTYRLAWHASAEVRMGPQPHPFVVPQSPPLQFVSQKLQWAAAGQLQISATGQGPTLVSARVQRTSQEATLPKVGLFCAAMDTSAWQAVECELLTSAFAETYFATSGAVVLLIGTLLPGSPYLLEVTAPKEKQADEVLVSITSDGPIALTNT